MPIKQVVIIFGPPGAGKGTQSELLSEKLDLHLFETSKILEKTFKLVENLPADAKERFVQVEGETVDVLKEQDNWKKGILCSPPYVTQIVINEMTKLCEEGKNLVLSGSPRTVYEAEREMPALAKLYGKENITVIFLEIEPEETVARNSHRKICELMRHSILFNSETQNLTLCPLDGSKLVKRADLDDLEVIKVRIREYTERTFPMVEYFKKNNFKIFTVNGGQAVAEVHEDILKIIE